MNLATLAKRFEDGTLEESKFNHREHLQIAFWYTAQYTERQAVVRIKHGILKYNLLFGVDQERRGYHETITMFYIKLAQRYLASAPDHLSLEEKCEGFVAQAGTDFRKSIAEYYSQDLLTDTNAILHWVPPDLKPI